jgi:Icc-related predicted phosphoesterase
MQKDAFWIAIGDIHEDISNVSKIPDLDKALGLIISGDITNSGGQKRAEQILKSVQEIQPNIYAQIGNMDKAEVTDFLQRKGWNIHLRGLEIEEGIGIMGVGYSNPTPFGTPSEVEDSQLEKWLWQALEDVHDLPHLILVCHTPPLDTKTDRLPNGQAVGSKAVRNFIEKQQPDICITGHIHEAVAQDGIGKTKIVNPGMISRGGYARIVRTVEGLDLELKKI